MKWDTKITIGMKLIHEACEENAELPDSCEACPFKTYCDIIWSELKVSPVEPRWDKMGGEDIR